MPPPQKLKKNFFGLMCSKNFCVQAKGGAIAQCPPPKYATGYKHTAGINVYLPQSPYLVWYGDSVDNTVEASFSVFSLIRMRWLPSTRACGQYNFAPTKSSSS